MKILILLLLTRYALAWDSHHLITEHTFSKKWVGDSQVAYTHLDKALVKKLKRFRASSQTELCLLLKIHKKWSFPTYLDETQRKSVPIREVLEKYSDEPDWGPDQNLFESDQYPELWNEDLKYVTQRSGFSSQAFRHQYYPGRFSWLSPIATFQIPLRALGEAPRRALIYMDLALDFFEAGQRYWGYRFLAWSFHYLQDLFQPFHASQTPTKRFIAFGWKGWLPAIDVETTGERIAYYHFAFEHWTDRYLKETSSPLAKVLEGEPPLPMELTYERILNDVVDYSNGLAPVVGNAAFEVFPKWNSKKDPLHRTAQEVVNSAPWQESVKAHPRMQAFRETTENLFRRMGEFVRSVSANHLPPR